MKKTVYCNPWFRVIQDEKWHYLEEVNSNNGAVVLLLKDNEKFIFIKTYRKAVNSIVIELPRGYGNNNESSTSTAIRESFEETGYKIKKHNIKKIGSVNPNSAILSSTVDIFFAKVSTVDLKKNHDDEVIELIEIDKDKIISVILSGKIQDAFSLSALSLYMAENCNKIE